MSVGIKDCQMIYDSWQYGDPMRILEQKQEAEARKFRSCGDCEHHQVMAFGRDAIHSCDCKRKKYGRRCEMFEPKGRK